MRKIILTILIMLFIAFPVFGSPGANTHSMDFERGSSQYVQAADSDDLDVSVAGTIELWVNFESVNVTQGFVSKFDENAPIDNMSYLFQFYAGTPSLFFKISPDGSTPELVEVSWSPSTATWYHVAVTWDGGAANEVKFYVNGVQQGATQTITSGGAFIGTAVFTIGSDTPNFSYFDGLIDDVRFWSDVRTVTEIANNKDTQLNGNEANLVGYWMLNNNAEDKGETTDPAGSVADDLTLVNSPVYSTSVPFTGIVASAESDNYQTIWWFEE